MRKINRFLTLLTITLLSIVFFSCNSSNNMYEIHTDLQKSYLEGDYKLIMSYAKGGEELSKPKAIVITWDAPKEVTEFDFYLSEENDFKEYRLYETNISQVELVNLKIHTKYYWYVEYMNEELIKTKIESFETSEKTPRNLDIDGITNVRDLGGYKIGKNKYTNQGLIFRSARFNENNSTNNLITEKGINEMVNILKIKTELDVRKTSNNENGGLKSSPLGENVNYFSIPMKTGGNYLLLNLSILKDVFKVFGNKDNYPIVIHCSIGTDRTGVICFLINALLGVEQEDLYKDYLFSMFGNIEGVRMPSTIDDYLKKINLSAGDTLKEKTFNYLINNGVSVSDLNSLIEIMTN